MARSIGLKFVTARGDPSACIQVSSDARRDPARAAESWVRREAAIAALEAEAERLAGKLDGQDSGARYRGRKLSDSGVKARFHHAVREAHLSHIVRVDPSAAAFVYDIDSDALARWQGWAKAAIHPS